MPLYDSGVEDVKAAEEPTESTEQLVSEQHLRLCEGRKEKQSAMDLSRGKITFCVYRGISEKGAENQALVVGHLK